VELDELPPEIEETPPVEAPASGTSVCPECGLEFTGAKNGAMSLGSHRKHAHPETWEAAAKHPAVRGKRAAAPRGGETAPKRAQPKRQSAGWLFAQLVQLIGGAMVYTEKDPRVGMALVVESPLAGVRVDNAIANTFPDRHLIQPLLRKGESAKDLGLVIGFPLMVALSERMPRINAQLRPFQEMIVAQLFTELRDLPRSDLADSKEGREAATQMGMDFDQVLNGLFPKAQPEETEPEPAPQPEPAPEPVAA
jgi:hypothetical protein